jgi:Xaa-Pro aminopeptidase
MVIKPGSLIQFDGGCTYDGYYTDIKRFASLGEPTEDQRRFYDIARAAEQASIDAVAPGVTHGEVYEASQKAIRDSGYPEFVDSAQEFRWTSIGHNIGLDLHEMPGIAKDNDAVLQPNQVICIEPFFYHDGGFPLWTVQNKYGCEDQVLVTETGHDVLSSDELISRDIWVA